VDSVDRKLVVEAEKGLFLTSQPFEKIASKIGIPVQEVIVRLQKLQENGVIRRFGVSLKPNGVGYCANALVAWKVPESRVEEIGAYFARYDDISHCYERQTIPEQWEYNIYTVIHAHEREAIERLVKLLASITIIEDYIIIYSTKNLKNQPAVGTEKC
jgi:DNA-binding Lrp family transcriptional regulator